MDKNSVRLARAGLTQVIEPADALGVVATKAWGPLRLTEIIRGTTPSQHDWTALMGQYADDSAFTKKLRHNLGSAIERWRRRSSYLNPEQALQTIANLGGGFVIPEDDQWPAALADLQSTEPLGLWTLGQAPLPQLNQILALVGSREATTYGSSATAMLATKARAMGLTVLSGGAYGIDAQAHDRALRVPGSGVATIAVLAGGLDRFYPAGNVELLHTIADNGLLLTEMPPGMRPNRYRFLHRNRLIAALSKVSIVVEARYRSGALNTAHHAHDLGRTVGAVPGPINVPSSAGCHRLIKDTPTLLIDDPRDLEQLYEPGTATQSSEHDSGQTRAHDMLTMEEMLVYEALPLRGGRNLEQLCDMTGLSVPRTTGILTKLSRHKLVESNASGWRQLRNTTK